MQMRQFLSNLWPPINKSNAMNLIIAKKKEEQSRNVWGTFTKIHVHISVVRDLLPYVFVTYVLLHQIMTHALERRGKHFKNSDQLCCCSRWQCCAFVLIRMENVMESNMTSNISTFYYTHCRMISDCESKIAFQNTHCDRNAEWKHTI